jgi:mRNA interferase MazF
MQRGDLITVALQGDAGKPRPALVIQADQFRDTPTIIVLPLTSTVLELPLLRVTVKPTAANGLQRPSQVMLSRPQTLLREKAGAVIGRLDPATMRPITGQFAVVLGMAEREVVEPEG